MVFKCINNKGAGTFPVSPLQLSHPQPSLEKPVPSLKMRASLQVLLALGTAAGAIEILRPAGLYRRQAFDPDEETLPAEQCSDFGPTYVECRAPSTTRPRFCIDPTNGETCCDNQCTYLVCALSSCMVLEGRLTCSRGMSRRLVLSRS